MGNQQSKAMEQEGNKPCLFITNTADISKKALGDATAQVNFTDISFEAVDRILSLNTNDVLLCEATCLSYAAHAMALEDGPRELWVVPPLQSGIKPSSEHLYDLEAALMESCEETLELLQSFKPRFRGFADATPETPFKLLITTQYCGVPISSALEWPLYNSFWIDMLNTEGATGAVIYPPICEQDEKNPSLRKDNLDPENFTQAVEISSGNIVLGLGKPDGTFLMEDLTDIHSPWSCEISAIELSVNDGCLVPSMFRSGIEVIEEFTIGDLASRISRGTTLSEKDLDVKKRLNSRVVEASEKGMRLSADGKKQFAIGGFSGGIYTPFDSWVYAKDSDLYYVDGSCFNKGEIWPTVLNCIPKGQERYIVDEHDGEVLLVSRNSKEPAVYKALRPTLIGNSVFVIRLESDINRDYLACWMRGSFAKRWLDAEGKMLSKSTLSSLPVPILSEEVMERAVQHEHAIEEKIFSLREEIGKLEHSNRFAPLAAMRERWTEGL